MIGVIFLRKLWLIFLFAIMLIPLRIATVSAADVTNINWVTRIDAPVPFVRMVLSLSEPVKATASIDKSGQTTTITMKNSNIRGAQQTVYMDRTIASKATLTQTGKNVQLKINTPSSIEPKDIKVFTLKNDLKNNRPYRLVVDIQKKGVAPRTTYYGSKPAIAPKTTTNTTPAQPYSISGGLKGKTIVIDPGHGGSDSGAVGSTGLMEKNVTLPIAMYLKKDLEEQGAKVLMTRTTDVDVYGPYASGVDELQARSDVANNNHADIFISVHINSFNSPNAIGIATYYYDKTAYDTRLATDIQNQIAGEPGFGGSRGIQFGNLYVLRHTTMPAVLVELGFISNPTEESLMRQPSVQQDFARRITQGVLNYFNK